MNGWWSNRFYGVSWWRNPTWGWGIGVTSVFLDLGRLRLKALPLVWVTAAFVVGVVV